MRIFAKEITTKTIKIMKTIKQAFVFMFGVITLAIIVCEIADKIK